MPSTHVLRHWKNILRSHDRFLLLDDEVYHIGASLKDLGKRWFAIMKMQETKAEDIIRHLQLQGEPFSNS